MLVLPLLPTINQLFLAMTCNNLSIEADIADVGVLELDNVPQVLFMLQYVIEAPNLTPSS